MSVQSSRSSLPAHARDMALLIALYAREVSRGASSSLATFKGVWRRLCFSLVLESAPLELSGAQHAQALFSCALGCLRLGLSRQLRSVLSAEAALAEAGGLLDLVEAPLEPGVASEPQVEVDALEPLSRRDLSHLELDGWVCKGAGAMALLCCFGAQPGPTLVKISLSTVDQDLLLERVPQLAAANQNEALWCIDSLFRTGAFVPSGPPLAVPSFAAADHWLRAGTGPGAEGAALAREVSFHAASALQGLGTRALDTECRAYEEALGAVWNSAPVEKEASPGLGRETAPAPLLAPLSISDLAVGRVLKEYAELKAGQVQEILRRNPRAPPPPSLPPRASLPPQAAASEAREQERAALAAVELSQRALLDYLVPELSAEDRALMLGSLHGAAQQALRRDLARRESMRGRVATWLRFVEGGKGGKGRAGARGEAGTSGEAATSPALPSSPAPPPEDMPLLPGLPAAELVRPPSRRSRRESLQPSVEDAGEAWSLLDDDEDSPAAAPALAAGRKRARRARAEEDDLEALFGGAGGGELAELQAAMAAAEEALLLEED